MPYTSAAELASAIGPASQGHTGEMRKVLDTMAGGFTFTTSGTLMGSGVTVATGTQASAIADPTGGATTDAEARTAIASIINALEAFGIVAAS